MRLVAIGSLVTIRRNICCCSKFPGLGQLWDVDLSLKRFTKLGVPFGGLFDKDSRILKSCLGSPCFGFRGTRLRLGAVGLDSKGGFRV